MPGTKPSDILGPVDTAFYYVDRPETPMNIGGLTIFEGKIDFDLFTKLVDARIHRAPLYQKRIVQAPMKVGPPTWVYDPDFFIGNHVFETTLEKPGSDEQLRKLAGQLVSGMLDRSKPLWEIHLIHGLQGDRTAILFKVHHCMVDGLSAVEIFTLLFDLTPDIPEISRKPLYDPPYLPSKSRLVVDAVRNDIPHKFGVLKKLTHDVFQIGSVVTDKERRRKALVGIANLINDNLRPIRRLAINGKNSGRMTVAYAEFSLAEVRAIKSNLQASVNDVMLTVYAKGIELYLRAVGDASKQDFVRVLVPVNMRAEDEKGTYGNRIAVLPVDIPFGVERPLELLQNVTHYSKVMKESSLSMTLDMILTLPSLAPAIAQPLVWGIAPKAFAFIAHTWCTNVAGPQIPLYILGHQMLHSYGYFPLNPSMGLACVVMSYNQKITMTLVADGDIIQDVTELKAKLEEAYLLLRKAAKVQEMKPIEIERPAPKPRPIQAAIPVPASGVAAPLPTAAPSTQSRGSTLSPLPTAAPSRPSARARANESIAAPESVPVASAVSVSRAEPERIVHTAEATPPIVIKPDPLTDSVVPTNSEVRPLTSSDNGRSSPLATPMATVVTEEKPIDTTLHDELPESSNNQSHLPVSDNLQPENVLEHSLSHGDNSPPSDDDRHIEEEVEHTPPPSEGKYKIFSEEWAQVYKEVINHSTAYRNASLKWTQGALAFVMNASPRNGFSSATAVLLDLHKGECRSARSLKPDEAMYEASFVIEGDYASWMKVLRGEAAPLAMLVRGKLRLAKGSMTKLLPFTKSAQELVHCAQGISG